MALNIWNSINNTFFPPKSAVVDKQQQNQVQGLFKNRTDKNVAVKALNNDTYNNGKRSAFKLYTSKGTHLGAIAKRESERANEKTPVQRALEQFNRTVYMDWESAAQYNKMSLLSQLFVNNDNEPKALKEDEVSKIASVQNKTTETETDKDKDKNPKQNEPESASADEVAGQISKGSFIYNIDDDNFYMQKQDEDGKPGAQKYCSVKDLQEKLGYDNPKDMSVKDNEVSFDKDSIYKFTGKGKKEHTIMSRSEVLTEDIIGAFNNKRDREAAEYAGFWSDLANGKEHSLYSKYTNDEIRGRLAGAGIQNGFFTVIVGESSQTYYLSEDKGTAALFTKEEYDSRYDKLSNGQIFGLERYNEDEQKDEMFKAGQTVTVGGRDYVLDKNKGIDIEYGAELY